MTEPKKTIKIEKPADDEEIAKGKITSQERLDQEKTESVRASAEIEKENAIVDKEAKIIGTDQKMEGEKSIEFSNSVIDKFKKGLSQVYEAGAKVVDDLSQTAQEYTEKHKTESEIKNLKRERDLLITSLGHYIFKQYRQKGKVSESFFNEEGIIGQFNQIELLDKKIINDGKRLDNVKE